MRITYEIITPESAEHGDAAERGFIEPKYKFRVPVEEAMNKEDWPADRLAWNVRDAELYLGRNGMEDAGRWFSSCDHSTINYQTGETIGYSLHPDDNVTPASYDRLKRIFCYDR